MNFLAHIFLSGKDERVVIGNFIGDFVKGKAWKTFQEPYQKGILLHREIDQFTDNHQTVLKSKERLRPKYRHYAPVITDVFYDHFLAKMWENYSNIPLLTFTQRFYQLTEEHWGIIPDRAKHMLTYMKRDNWLYNYQYIDEINRALTGMSRRTPYHSKMDQAAADLKNDYEAYQKDFEQFFPRLIAHARVFLQD